MASCLEAVGLVNPFEADFWRRVVPLEMMFLLFSDLHTLTLESLKFEIDFDAQSVSMFG